MRGLFRFFTAVIIVLLSGFFIRTHAQPDGKSSATHRFSLRFAPLSLLESDGNIMVGLGYQWHPRWAFTIDPGYIGFAILESVDDRRSSVSGIKIRSDIRYFFEKNRKGLFDVFIGPEFHYKYVRSRKWDRFGINCLGNQCDYYQDAEYTEVKKEIGAAIKLGTVIPLGGNRWFVEIYGGLGFKFKRFRETDIPVGGSFIEQPQRDTFFNTNDPDVAYITLPAGAKIVFRIK